MRLGTDFRSEGPGRANHSGYTVEIDSEETISSLWSDDKQIIQKFVDLDYRAYRENRPNVRKLLDSIAELASNITEGFPIMFAGIGEDNDGLFPRFKTPDGIVPMSVLSQGTQSLLQWTAQLVIGYAEYYKFPDSFAGCSGVAIIDEIDAHLHPSWQRRILPAIKRQFPDLQIICAAHSPMTLAGLDAGQIHLLCRDLTGQIAVMKNKTDILGWSADEIYSTIFGVEPTDLETSDRLRRVRQLRSREPNLSLEETAELKRLRAEIQQGLSGGSVTETADVLADELKKAAKAASRNSLQPGNVRRKPTNSKQSSPVGR
ncbi:MAG: ATP-binding protein [Acidobacteriaceae bacterium]|nr:ATP-binding protein [Acidobacteriaceae bacterium]